MSLSRERVNKYKYLGIIFDNRLNWNEHLKYIHNRLRRCIYMFTVLSRVLSTKLIKTVYYAYVQSIIQYGIIAWGGVSKNALSQLNITQKAIMKRALTNHYFIQPRNCSRSSGSTT